jgi:hypothetical protein
MQTLQYQDWGLGLFLLIGVGDMKCKQTIKYFYAAWQWYGTMMRIIKKEKKLLFLFFLNFAFWYLILSSLILSRAGEGIEGKFSLADIG